PFGSLRAARAASEMPEQPPQPVSIPRLDVPMELCARSHTSTRARCDLALLTWKHRFGLAGWGGIATKMPSDLGESVVPSSRYPRSGGHFFDVVPSIRPGASWGAL